MRQIIQTILPGFVMLLAATAAEPEVTLVEAGQPQAVIVLEEHPTRSAQLGALELNHFLRLITGAELPVVRGACQDRRFQIRIGGDNADFPPGEKTVIRFSPGAVRLTGFDSSDRNEVDYADRFTWPHLDYEYKSPLFAVYDFLESCCGVRFYGFGDDVCFEPRTTLRVPVRNRESAPACDAFREIGAECFTPLVSPSKRDLALWRLRWRMSSNFARANHNEYTIYYAHWGEAAQPALQKSFRGQRPELFAQHPDRYGKDPVLVRAYPNAAEVSPHLCYSNPGTIAFYADETLAYLAGKTVPGGWGRGRIRTYPGIPFYYPIQGSDVPYGHCRCETCLKRFADGKPDSVSNRKFQFISDVAAAAAQRDPRAGVATLGYFETYAYPEAVELADNVSVELCPVIFSWWHPLARERQYGMYRQWMTREGKRRPMTIWGYLYSGGAWDARYHYGNYKPFVDVWPWEAAKIVKTFVDDGVRGMYYETDVTYCHLAAYLAMKIAWDPQVDADRLIDEYFARYFGKGGEAMKAFYRKCENLYWNPAKYTSYLAPERNRTGIDSPKGMHHNYWTTGLLDIEADWRLISERDMAELDGLIRRAGELAATPAEKRRVATVADGIWKTAQEGFREYQLYKQRKTMPLRVLPAVAIPDAKGSPDRVEWQKIPAMGNWTDALGRANGSRCTVRTALDDHFLYLELIDEAGPDAFSEAGKWSDDFEIFLAVPDQPVRQLAVFGNGSRAAFRYEQGKPKPSDLPATVDSTRVNGAWRVRLAVPREAFALTRPRGCRINFARSHHGLSLWNPIFTGSLPAGIDNAGILALPVIYEDSTMTGDKINDPAAGDGRAAAMPVNRGWSVGMTIPADFPAGRYRLTAVLRSDAPTGKNLRHGIGFYDKTAKKQTARTVMVDAIAGPGYHAVDLGGFDVKPGMQFFLGGISRDKPRDTQLPDRKLYCDRIELVPTL